MTIVVCCIFILSSQKYIPYVTAKISAGNSFTCGIRKNGAVECWGKNDMGQSNPPFSLFRQLSASAGGDHACGILLDDGAVRCWGNNGRGQSENQEGEFQVVMVERKPVKD